MAKVPALLGVSAVRKIAVLGLLLAALEVMPAIAAGEPIATAVGVRQSASGVLEGVKITLKAEDDLFEGQTIATGSRGQVQIVFADETHMVVGPGSTLLIQKILMRNNGTASNFAVSALGGTFRFITGKSNKNAYKIATPTATIGVRGPVFDLTVTDKETNVLLYEGEVNVCSKSGGCETVQQKCDVGISQQSDASVVKSGDDNHSTSDFPYAQSQSSLQTDFRTSSTDDCDQGPAPFQSETKSQPEPTVDPGPDKPAADPDPIPDPLPGG
jgi:hypothetical protein